MNNLESADIFVGELCAIGASKYTGDFTEISGEKRRKVIQLGYTLPTVVYMVENTR